MGGRKGRGGGRRGAAGSGGERREAAGSGGKQRRADLCLKLFAPLSVRPSELPLVILSEPSSVPLSVPPSVLWMPLLVGPLVPCRCLRSYRCQCSRRLSSRAPRGCRCRCPCRCSCRCARRCLRRCNRRCPCRCCCLCHRRCLRQSFGIPGTPVDGAVGDVYGANPNSRYCKSRKIRNLCF